MGAKKKKQTIGYWYRLGVQAAVSHSPVDYISQIIFGERTGWVGKVQDGEIYLDDLDLFGGDKKEGGIKGKVYIHSGKQYQQINPYVAKMRGQTSAQRGLLTLVFGDGGNANANQTRAINFSNSTLSQYAEDRLGFTPKGLLTSTNQDVSKEQAVSWISNFYADGIKPYQEKDDEDRNGNGKKGEWVEPIEDQKEIYGNYRAVCLMFAYRAFVLGNLIPNPKMRFNSSDFFGKLVRSETQNRAGTQPFYWCAMSPYFKAIWVRVQNILSGWGSSGAWYESKAIIEGSPHTTDNGQELEINDMNPAHIIYKVLTNSSWGMGYNPSDIDDVSFRKAADALFDEKFGLSVAWRNEKTIEDFIGGILETIDGSLRINVITGKFELILIRNDYDVAALPVLDEDCIIELSKFERASWGDSPNEVVLTYKDRNEENAVVTVQNLAAIEIQGGVISSSHTFEAVHEPDLAARIAERELRQLSTPLAKINLKVNRMGFLLQQGDVFNLQWATLGIENLPCRVMSITRGEFDDGTIDIEAVEDIFGMPKQTYVKPQVPLWQDTSPFEPKEIADGKVWEAPLFDVAQNIAGVETSTEIADNNAFVRLFAAQPTDGSPNFDLYQNSSQPSRLSANEAYTPTFILADRVNRTTQTLAFSDINNPPSAITNTMYIVVDNEAMLIENINLSNNTIQVKRGILDTIPEYHAVNSVGWITDAQQAVDETQRANGDYVSYKPLANTPRGNIPYAQQREYAARLVGRAYRPFPPAGVRINNQYFPDKLAAGETLRISWDTRNRKLIKNNFDWNYGNITSEPDVKYDLKITDVSENKVIIDESGLTTTSKSYPAPIVSKPFTQLSVTDNLAYLYQFDTYTQGNEIAPKQGNLTTPAKSFKGDVEQRIDLSTNSKYGNKHFHFGSSANLRLPITQNIATWNFTIGFRYQFNNSSVTAILASFETPDKGSIGVIYAYGTNLIFALEINAGASLIKFEISGIESGFHDVLMRFNNQTQYITVWIDGIQKYHQQHFPLSIFAKLVDNEQVNLLKRENAVSGYLDTSGNIASPDAYNITSDYIPVEFGKTYCYQIWRSINGSSAWNGWYFYDADKKPIGSRQVTNATSTLTDNTLYSDTSITVPKNAAFIRIGSRNGTAAFMMFSEGNTAKQPIFAKADNPFNFDASQSFITIGIRHINGRIYQQSDSGFAIDGIYLYDAALSDADIAKLNTQLVGGRWGSKMRIELYSKRGGVQSWQTFVHTWETE